MQFVLVALLTAGSGLPTPAQQQQSATAVYRAHYAIIAHGVFTEPIDDEFALTVYVHDSLATEGTAFAVDPDGWLLTARHVVDPEGLARSFCEEMAKPDSPYVRYRVDRIQLDMTLTDIVGNVWPARFMVTPAKGSTGDVCRSTQLAVEYDPLWPVAIVKMDDTADVALMKLTQSHGPVAALPFGTMAGMHEWHPVYALGFPGRGKGVLTMAGGLLARPCEEGLATTHTERLTRYMMEARPGFSGGPVVASDKLMGVTVRAGSTDAEPTKGISSVGVTFAVPVDYVHAWYLWVRGLSPNKPTEVCKP